MKALFLVLISLFIIFSCSTVEQIDVRLDKPKIVVNSIINPDSSWSFSLTQSRDVIDVAQTNFFLPIRNASVDVYSQNGNLLENIQDPNDIKFPDRYKGNSKPLSGQRYFIKVKIQGSEDIETMSEVPVAVPVESYEIDSSRYKSQPGGKVQMKIAVNDPASEKNFYYIKIIREGYYIGFDTVKFTEEVHYEHIDPAYKNALESPVKDNLFNGTRYNFNFNINPVGNGTTVHLKVAVLSISESYYLYLATKNVQQQTKDDPFAQPTLLYSNINGGTGLFAGYSLSVINLK